MDAALWIRLMIVLTVASAWIGFLVVLREVAKRRILTFRVKREVRRIAEAHAFDPSRLEPFLDFYYGDAYDRDLGVISFGPNGAPLRDGSIRLRLDFTSEESSSNERLRIVPLGLKSMRHRAFEPMESIRGWIDLLSIKIQKRNL